MGKGIGAARDYRTSIDGVGKALGAGSLLGGLLILMLLIGTGQRAPLALVTGVLLGAIFAGIALAAVGGPIWLVLHALGLRRGRYAAVLTGALGLGLYLGAQGYGTALYTIAPIDTRNWLVGLALKGAQSLAVGLIAAGIGLAMWRIAYRPEA
ncbi:hypothetical protein [Sphingomonas pokkalii]|uniref:Uncharacterized protein n=1 Tax=Sphingomonas pokkalii TaxID=2175090 RepID=A0A2U0SFP6_9SPHN|nr:hypothetical protein [Sphingomonas pokkalii]PVX30188.1 hypothetical protein DD559_13310 [Sphingomonas pokkalii]